MADYLCHDEPDLHCFDARVIAARPGAVVLDRSALHPGGGGQPSDLGLLTHAGGTARIVGVSIEGALHWHLLEPDLTLQPQTPVSVAIDTAHRHTIAQLHTASHALNALVFQRCEGALVTGAQLNGNGTGRMDFDLPDADNAMLRSLQADLNSVLREGRRVFAARLPCHEVHAAPGLIRSRSVAPEPARDGCIRIIEIEGLDRQACGGTHLSNTAQCRPVRIDKIENKGRHNRRVRLSLEPG